MSYGCCTLVLSVCKMFPHRHSCDRCRQQKVRCLKNWELQAAGGGSGEHLALCERCAKADVPCVYSSRQKNRRASHQLRGREANPVSPRRSTQFGQDLTGVLSRSDVIGSDLGDHVLALFRAICDSIERSLGSIGPVSEQQQQALHGNGASSAQFVMVLQLVMHMINRIGRSLRIGSRDAGRSVAVIHPHDLTFGLEDREEGGGSQSVVDLAQEMLRALPDEHDKIKQAIQGLQTCIEERI